MIMKNKVAILTICLGFASSSIWAAGFGVSGEAPAKKDYGNFESNAVARLLGSSKSYQVAHKVVPQKAAMPKTQPVKTRPSRNPLDTTIEPTDFSPFTIRCPFQCYYCDPIHPLGRTANLIQLDQGLFTPGMFCNVPSYGSRPAGRWISFIEADKNQFHRMVPSWFLTINSFTAALRLSIKARVENFAPCFSKCSRNSDCN